MAIAGSVAAAPMYGEPTAGNTGPNSTNGDDAFPPGKELGVQEWE
jgi:hypothetical protein